MNDYAREALHGRIWGLLKDYELPLHTLTLIENLITGGAGEARDEAEYLETVLEMLERLRRFWG